MLDLSFCNELLADEGKSFDAQCALAKALGYMGLELSPGTLGTDPHKLPESTIATIEAALDKHQLKATGLHWLLAPYPELSITDPTVRAETQHVLTGLIDLCGRLGGSVLVHGSPGQRQILAGETLAMTRDRVIEFFKPIAAHAEAVGVTYCLEPLSRKETAFINTVAEAAEIVEAIGSPHFRTMIDTSAAAQSETMSVAELIGHWVPTGLIGHVQLNDSNRGAPGTGDDPFGDIVAALIDVGWQKPLAVEPFVTKIDASVTAAIAQATIKACWAAAQ